MELKQNPQESKGEVMSDFLKGFAFFIGVMLVLVVVVFSANWLAEQSHRRERERLEWIRIKEENQ